MKNEEKQRKHVELAMDQYMKIGYEKYSDKYINEAHKHVFKNYEEILRSKVCTCMYCSYQIKSDKLNEELPYTTERDETKTLLCPMCGIDCVLGDAEGFPVTDIYFIARFTRKWFSGYSRIDDGAEVEKINWVTVEVE